MELKYVELKNTPAGAYRKRRLSTLRSAIVRKKGELSRCNRSVYSAYPVEGHKSISEVVGLPRWIHVYLPENKIVACRPLSIRFTPKKMEKPVSTLSMEEPVLSSSAEEVVTSPPGIIHRVRRRRMKRTRMDNGLYNPGVSSPLGFVSPEGLRHGCEGYGRPVPVKKRRKGPLWVEKNPSAKFRLSRRNIEDIAKGAGGSATVIPRSQCIVVHNEANDEVTIIDTINSSISLFGKEYSERSLRAAAETAFSNTLTSAQRTAILHDEPFPTRTTIHAIFREVILPIVKSMHDASVNTVIQEYKDAFNKRFPDWPPNKAIPVGLASDGRWQKRWGWDSLDGHSIAIIYCPFQDVDLELSQNYIGVQIFH